MTAPWTETTLPTILSRYPLENIFNVDEFGLFYQCLPNKTLYLKGEKCSGGKHSKIRLTGLAAGNAYGERLPMFVIGKANKPRCFKGVRNLPCRYRAQRKSWMTAELFEEWVRELDLKGALSGLRKFLATESPLKMMKNVFYFISKALFVLKIFKFLS